jgi:hypothetical protein
MEVLRSLSYTSIFKNYKRHLNKNSKNSFFEFLKCFHYFLFFLLIRPNLSVMLGTGIGRGKIGKNKKELENWTKLD